MKGSFVQIWGSVLERSKTKCQSMMTSNKVRCSNLQKRVGDVVAAAKPENASFWKLAQKHYVLHPCLLSWRCGNGSIAEAVIHFLSVSKEQNSTRTQCLGVSELCSLAGPHGWPSTGDGSVETSRPSQFPRGSLQQRDHHLDAAVCHKAPFLYCCAIWWGFADESHVQGLDPIAAQYQAGWLCFPGQKQNAPAILAKKFWLQLTSLSIRVSENLHWL